MKTWIVSLCFFLVLVTIIPTTYATQTTNQAKSHTIFITGCPTKGTCFYPCQITVVKGDTITWVNLSTINHMIISGSGQHGPDGWFSSPDGWFSSPGIFSHGVFSHVFDRKGTFPYYDSTHTYAQGVVIIDSSIHSNFVKLQQSYYSDWCNR